MEDGQSLKPTVRAKKAVSSACSGDMFRKCTAVIYSSAFVSAKSFDNYNRSLHFHITQSYLPLSAHVITLYRLTFIAVYIGGRLSQDRN